MRRLVCLLAILVSVQAQTSSAKLGESVADVAVYYGAPTNDLSKPQSFYREYVYSRSGFRIFVTFHEGKSIFETYFASTPNISDSQILLILKGNAAPQETWTEVEETNGKRTWLRSDKHAIAELGYTEDGQPMLSVISAEYQRLHPK